LPDPGREERAPAELGDRLAPLERDFERLACVPLPRRELDELRALGREALLARVPLCAALVERPLEDPCREEPRAFAPLDRDAGLSFDPLREDADVRLRVELLEAELGSDDVDRWLGRARDPVLPARFRRDVVAAEPAAASRLRSANSMIVVRALC